MRSILSSAFVLWLALASFASAKSPELVDRANFFSEQGKTQANALIEQLRTKHRVEVRVETFESVPASSVERVKAMSPRERGEYFAGWLKDLAKERSSEGIFILICREPSHLRMGVSKALHQRGFTDAERDAALKPMIAAFKEKEYDKGLTSSLEAIRDAASHLKGAAGFSQGSRIRPPAPAASIFSGMTGWIVLGVGGLLVFALIASVVAAFSRGGSGGAMLPGGYGGGGGGGMFGSLLAGIGGAMAGNWLYDQFSGRSAHAGYPDNSTDYGGQRDDGYQDFSSGGDDFGDSGGGDFGGGDSGGDGGGDF